MVSQWPLDRLEGLVAAERRLAARFGLPMEPWMQDWPIEIADPAYIDPVLEALPSITDIDERVVAVELLVVSFDALLERLADDSRWPRFVAILEGEFWPHEPTIRHWALVENDERDEWFFVTAALRPLYRRCADGR